MRNTLLSLFLLITVSCGIETPEEEGFKYTFENTLFRQTRYRAIDETIWKIHQGRRTIQVTPLEFIASFNNYREYSGGIYCFGEFKATFEYHNEESFFQKLTNTNPGEALPPSFYDVFDPWQEPPVISDPNDEEVAEVANYFMIIKVKSNGVTNGCSNPVEETQYAHFIFYTNGDLIYRDYNRGIEFQFRPN